MEPRACRVRSGAPISPVSTAPLGSYTFSSHADFVMNRCSPLFVIGNQIATVCSPLWGYLAERPSCQTDPPLEAELLILIEQLPPASFAVLVTMSCWRGRRFLPARPASPPRSRQTEVDAFLMASMGRQPSRGNLTADDEPNSHRGGRRCREDEILSSRVR